MERTVSKIENTEERLKQFLQHRGQYGGRYPARFVRGTSRRRRRTCPSLPCGHQTQVPHGAHGCGRLARRPGHRQAAAFATGRCCPGRRCHTRRQACRTQAPGRAQGSPPQHQRAGEENRKAIVFCAFADTAAYLYEELEDWSRNTLGIHIATVSGGARPNRSTFGQAEFTRILTNFAPAPNSGAR